MLLKGFGLTGGIILGTVALVSRQRNLGVHDDRLLARQVHHEIRADDPAVFGPRALLDGVFPVFLQPGGLQHALDDQLTPITLLLAVTLDGPGEVVCFIAHPVVQLLELAHLLLQAHREFRVAAMHLIHALAERVELAPERLEHCVKTLAVLFG